MTITTTPIESAAADNEAPVKNSRNTNVETSRWRTSACPHCYSINTIESSRHEDAVEQESSSK